MGDRLVGMRPVISGFERRGPVRAPGP